MKLRRYWPMVRDVGGIIRTMASQGSNGTSSLPYAPDQAARAVNRFHVVRLAGHVLASRWETPDTRTLRLTFEPSTLPPLLAGADFMISAIGVSGRGEARPEDVDYGGSVALIDAAKSAGIKKFIMVTSGGVTWRIHPLNWTGRNVLKWKRKAELYLRASGLTHVIVRPNGGLSDKPANTNRITFTQNDKFAMRISREDVAIVCAKTLAYKEADNKTFEIQNDDDGSVVKDVDWRKTFSAMVIQSDNF